MHWKLTFLDISDMLTSNDIHFITYQESDSIKK